MTRKEKKIYSIRLSAKQKRALKESLKEGNEDLVDFLRKSAKWRNGPSLNDQRRLR